MMMKITLDNVEYTAPAPVTGLWFTNQKFKTEQAQRIAVLNEMFDTLDKYKGRKDLTDSETSARDSLFDDLTKKTEEHKYATLKSKIEIIVAAFKNEKVTLETILEWLPLQEVAGKYLEVNALLDNLLTGKTAELPNDQTLEA